MPKQDERFHVWPRPQEMQIKGQPLSLRNPIGLSAQGEADWIQAAAEEAATVLNDAAGRTVVRPKGRSKTRLLVTDMTEPPRGMRAVKTREGYALSVSAQGIHLAGADPAGVYYGAQTLAQLLASEGGKALPAAQVRDWPRYPFRGVHLYMPAREHLDFFWRFLDFLAGLKCNTLFLETGGGMELEKHPEINRSWKKFCKEADSYDFDKDNKIPESKTSCFNARDWNKKGPVALQVSRYFAKDSTHTELAGGEWLTKDEVRLIVHECEKRHIEIIPEIQALSHSYYLCCAHPEIAEHHEDPWPDTYCPSNPKSYELWQDVADEIIEVVKPRFVSIGHDEAYTFRICPECRKRTAHEILADEITRNRDFLASRGVRTMMWGDKLMNITTPEGRRYGGIARRRTDPVSGKTWVQPATYKAADKVPDDVIMVDWYWGLDPKSERNFHKKGFEVVYGNFSPMRFENWESRADLPYVHGAEMSSWCGVTPYEFGHNGTFYQFFPGSDMLWNGRQMPKHQVAPLMARWMTPAVEKMTQQERWLVTGKPGNALTLDISEVAKEVPDDLKGKLKTGAEATTVLGTGPFHVLTDKRGAIERALCLAKADSAKRVSLPVGRKAKRVMVLHGTTMRDLFAQPTYYSYHRGPAEIVRYQITYADGKRDQFAGYFKDNVGRIDAPWPDGQHCFQAVPVEAGKGRTLYAFEWTNPRKDVPIESLTISLGPDASDEGEVVIAAVALVI